ncbi:hypothetical protein EDD22DRAFT_176815 [Suillus occidentalis]|nr:hypothetical protein EDD22DRAFT_176815 [Suillus occidentalis]
MLKRADYKTGGAHAGNGRSSRESLLLILLLFISVRRLVFCRANRSFEEINNSISGGCGKKIDGWVNTRPTRTKRMLAKWESHVTQI